MTKFAKTAMTALAVALVSQAAQAGYVANDLVIGFDRVDNGGSGPQPNDYIIDLGNANNAVGVGGTAQVNLTGQFSASTFNGIYTSLSSGVSMSIVGGNGATSGRDIFATVQRIGLGTPGVAGSSAPPSLASTFMAGGANDVAAMINNVNGGISAGQSTTVAQSDPNSFSTWVLSTVPPSYLSSTGIDPRASTTGSVLYEDLYKAANNVNGNNFSYLGYFTLDTTSGASLTFTPIDFVPVPEPTTYGVFAGVGLLALMFRRHVKAKKA